MTGQQLYEKHTEYLKESGVSPDAWVDILPQECRAWDLLASYVGELIHVARSGKLDSRPPIPRPSSVASRPVVKR